MKYTEKDVIGLKLRHKGYADDDIMSKYTVGYGKNGSELGLWYHISKTPGDVRHTDYSIDSINQNIESGSWIVDEQTENYPIF
jgi:hypothetical protein